MRYPALALILCCFIASCSKNGDDTSTTGCRLTTSHYIFQQGGARIQLPNAFTPNGDGRNDYFRPVGATGMQTFGMAVYDHDGNILFQTTDPYSQGWDGSKNGSLVGAGYYSVKLQFTTVNGDAVDRQECVALCVTSAQGCIQRTSYGAYYFEDMLDPNNPAQTYGTTESICP